MASETWNQRTVTAIRKLLPSASIIQWKYYGSLQVNLPEEQNQSLYIEMEEDPDSRLTHVNFGTVFRSFESSHSDPFIALCLAMAKWQGFTRTQSTL